MPSSTAVGRLIGSGRSRGRPPFGRPSYPCRSAEDVAMRTAFDFSPLFRSSVGFDHVLDLLSSAADPQAVDNWPPYDIAKAGEDRYRITVAVAGFAPEELDIVIGPVPHHRGRRGLRARGAGHSDAAEPARGERPEAGRRQRAVPVPRHRGRRVRAPLPARRLRPGEGDEPRERAADGRARARGAGGAAAAPDRGPGAEGRRHGRAAAADRAPEGGLTRPSPSDGTRPGALIVRASTSPSRLH